MDNWEFGHSLLRFLCKCFENKISQNSFRVIYDLNPHAYSYRFLANFSTTAKTPSQRHMKEKYSPFHWVIMTRIIQKHENQCWCFDTQIRSNKWCFYLLFGPDKGNCLKETTFIFIFFYNKFRIKYQIIDILYEKNKMFDLIFKFLFWIHVGRLTYTNPLVCIYFGTRSTALTCFNIKSNLEIWFIVKQYSSIYSLW